MTDTPTLDEALEQASSTLTTSEEESEEQPQEVQEEAEEAQDPQEESEEESFADKPELEGKSPEELEEIYTNWQRAYTQKRQAEKKELAKIREEMERLKAQVPQEPQIPIDQMSPQQLSEYFAGRATKIAETARENAYIESQEKAFYEIDNRLNEDSPNHDEGLFYTVVGKVTKLRDQYEKENGSVFGFDFVGEAKKAIQAYDESVKKQVQNYLGNKNQTVKDKAQKFQKSNPKTKAGEVKKAGGLDLDDAFNEALAETGGSFGF